MSLKELVFTWRKDHPHGTKQDCYRAFKDRNKNSLRTYFNAYTIDIGDISNEIYLKNLDPVEWMEVAIQQIDDPDKRATQLSRLHAMKLRPLINREEKTLQEIFDAA